MDWDWDLYTTAQGCIQRFWGVGAQAQKMGHSALPQREIGGCMKTGFQISTDFIGEQLDIEVNIQ